MEEKNIIDDLIQVNNDRVAGYLKAAEQLDDPRLKNLLTAKVVQSRLFIYQLRQRTNTAGYSNEQNSRSSGHIYNTWKNLNPTFGCSDSKASLESFEYGEDAVLEVYDKALEHDIDLPLRSLLIEQENRLRQSHAEAQSLKDRVRA